MNHTITLGNSRQIGIASYVSAIKTAIQNPNQSYRHGLTTWWPVSGKDIRREFKKSIHNRINQQHIVLLDDKRQDKRILNHRKEVGCECKWCGQRFIPKTLNDHFCSIECRRDYY